MNASKWLSNLTVFHAHNIFIIKYVPILVVNSCRAVARGGAEGAFTDCSNFHLGVFDDSTFSGTVARGGAEEAFTDFSNFHLGIFDDSTFSGILAYEISLCYVST